MKGLGGTIKKERSKALSELKREVCDEAYDAMVGTDRAVQAVQLGTGDSVKCRDGAYRQIVVQNADEWGVAPGDHLTVEVTEARTVYALGRPC